MPKPDASVAALVARLTGREPELRAHGPIAVLRVTRYPSTVETTLVTSGLGTVARTLFRRLPVGFELVAVTTEPDLVEARLLEVLREELAADARGDRHTRVARIPPRGVMQNGAFEATTAPHLVFSSQLSRNTELAGRHRVGAGFVELLPAVAIDAAELAAYDACPRDLVAQLAASRS
jgi:hypothetical protein